MLHNAHRSKEKFNHAILNRLQDYHTLRYQKCIRSNALCYGNAMRFSKIDFTKEMQISAVCWKMVKIINGFHNIGSVQLTDIKINERCF